MTELKNYLDDGANAQAKAVLAYLQSKGDIEESWNDEYKRYTSEIKVARWENGREQGYICMLHDAKYKQLNIAFFEHRNSDSICAIKWHQNTMNTPTIDTADFNGECYDTKWNVSFEVSYFQIVEMGDWIFEQFVNHYADSIKPVEE